MYFLQENRSLHYNEERERANMRSIKRGEEEEKSFSETVFFRKKKEKILYSMGV